MSRLEAQGAEPKKQGFMKRILKRFTGSNDVSAEAQQDQPDTASANDQIQCNLYHMEGDTPRRTRLAGIEQAEWAHLRSVVPHEKAPLMASLLACGAPIRLNRKSLEDLMSEIKTGRLDHELAHIDEYITFTMFLLQAHEQIDAEAIFEIDPDARYDGPTFLT